MKECNAILTDKRYRPNGNGQYMVTVTCSNCKHSHNLAFSGWDEFECLECGYAMIRTPYKKEPLTKP